MTEHNVNKKWYNQAANENLPGMCQKGILQEIEIIEDLVDDLNKAGEQSARCEATYKALYAQKRLMVVANAVTKKSIPDIEMEVDGELKKEHLDYLIAQNKLVTTREALRAAQSRLDAWRSLAAGYRSAGG